MTFSSWKPQDEFMQRMMERALRFAPPPTPERIEPVVDIEATLESVERRRMPLTHELNKPIEQVLAEEMAYYSVPF